MRILLDTHAFPWSILDRDPFGRLLVAQAKAEDIPLVSGDETLDAYPIVRVW